ncbi:MAG: P-loop NTPase [Deltaproteobacteria bacterium]|nr:P-loop NTPase [Deltaproteobacteria bacterium]
MKSYFDIAGDGGSRVLEQVRAKQSRIAAALAGVRRMVAVGSGKGGVGKSTLTLQLAHALREDGASVAILDADLNGPSQARMTGLGSVAPVPGPDGLVLPRTAAGIGVVSMGLFVPESAALDFESVAAGDSYVWRATKEFAVLGDLLAGVAWGPLDFLLVDLPPGAERTVQYAEFFGAAAALVLVTLPSDLSRGVVARSVAGLRRAPNRVLGYVENMKGYCCSECGSVRPLFAESSAIDLGIPCLGAVPFDPALAAACDRGEPLPAAAAGPAWPAVRSVAAAIRGALEAS